VTSPLYEIQLPNRILYIRFIKRKSQTIKIIFYKRTSKQVNKMDFCPKCGSMLQTSKKDSSIVICPKCRYQQPTEHREPSKKISIPLGKGAEIAVIDQRKEAMLRQHSTIHMVCETCGNTESETWTVEAADETIHSSITFFRCTKCKATKRESG
jgi:DNA-directed RNA polymerase subunit M/transcription elongation factor TFIIS